MDTALAAAKASEQAARTQETAASEKQAVAVAEQARLDRIRAHTCASEAQTVVERMARRLDAPNLSKSPAMADVRRTCWMICSGTTRSSAGTTPGTPSPCSWSPAPGGSPANSSGRSAGRPSRRPTSARRSTLDKLVADAPGEADYRHVLAATYASLGRLFRETDRNPEAEGYNARALPIWADLAVDRPQQTTYHDALVTAHQVLHKLMAPDRRAEADAVCGRLLAPYEAAAAPADRDRQLRLADPLSWAAAAYDTTGRAAEKAAAEDRALALYGQLPAAPPADQEVRRNMVERHLRHARLLAARKRVAEAEAAYRRALAFMVESDNPDRIIIYSKAVADVEFRIGSLLDKEPDRGGDSETAFRRALGLHQKQFARFPADPVDQAKVAECSNNLGVLVGSLRRYEEVEPLYSDSIPAMEKAVAAYPESDALRRNLA